MPTLFNRAFSFPPACLTPTPRLTQSLHVPQLVASSSHQPLAPQGTAPACVIGIASVDENFARQHNFSLFNLNFPDSLKVIDGRPIKSDYITQIIRVTCNIGNHLENLPVFIPKLGLNPLVPGIPRL